MCGLLDRPAAESRQSQPQEAAFDEQTPEVVAESGRGGVAQCVFSAEMDLVDPSEFVLD